MPSGWRQPLSTGVVFLGRDYCGRDYCVGTQSLKNSRYRCRSHWTTVKLLVCPTCNWPLTTELQLHYQESLSLHDLTYVWLCSHVTGKPPPRNWNQEWALKGTILKMYLLPCEASWYSLWGSPWFVSFIHLFHLQQQSKNVKNSSVLL